MEHSLMNYGSQVEQPSEFFQMVGYPWWRYICIYELSFFKKKSSLLLVRASIERQIVETRLSGRKSLIVQFGCHYYRLLNLTNGAWLYFSSSPGSLQSLVSSIWMWGIVWALSVVASSFQLMPNTHSSQVQCTKKSCASCHGKQKLTN